MNFQVVPIRKVNVNQPFFDYYRRTMDNFYEWVTSQDVKNTALVLREVNFGDSNETDGIIHAICYGTIEYKNRYDTSQGKIPKEADHRLFIKLIRADNPRIYKRVYDNYIYPIIQRERLHGLIVLAPIDDVDLFQILTGDCGLILMSKEKDYKILGKDYSLTEVN